MFKLQVGAKQRQARDKAKQAEKKQAQAPSKPLATFEAHTKGIGGKLMALMGYKEGQGLGRDLQGRAKPVEVRVRPKNQGLGHNDYEEQQHAPAMEKDEQQTAKVRSAGCPRAGTCLQACNDIPMLHS